MPQKLVFHSTAFFAPVSCLPRSSSVWKGEESRCWVFSRPQCHNPSTPPPPSASSLAACGELVPLAVLVLFYALTRYKAPDVGNLTLQRHLLHSPALFSSEIAKLGYTFSETKQSHLRQGRADATVEAPSKC